jgi:hypothetical protein
MKLIRPLSVGFFYKFDLKARCRRKPDAAAAKSLKNLRKSKLA